MAGNQIPYTVNCNLCGCTGASVRCSKCNSMAFCIDCDDMYHRHPKRRNHLRQAVALEYIQLMEKQRHQQQSEQQHSTPAQINNNIKNSSNTTPLYPWRVARTLPRTPEMLWENKNGHPSKMPIPPPRRKKKNYFIAGIKDTLRKWVNSPTPSEIKPSSQSHVNHPTINQSLVKQNQLTAPNPIKSSKSVSAFRPLPPTPATDELYANMRKHSMQPLQPPQNVRMLKTKQITTSAIDLQNNDRINNLTNKSSLPRNNFSQRSFESEDNEDKQSMMFSNFRGSTQSMYPTCNINDNEDENIQINKYCPSTSTLRCNNHCSHFNHHHHCHCHQQQQKQMFNCCCNNTIHHQQQQPWASNSNEELRYNNNNNDDESDDENDLLIMKLLNDSHNNRLPSVLSRDIKNRLRRAKMKRSQSTYTMFNGDNNFNYNDYEDENGDEDDGDDDDDDDEEFQMKCRAQNLLHKNRMINNNNNNSNNHKIRCRSSSIIRDTSKIHHQPSPSPSIKSSKSFQEKYRHSDLSDSSSSSQSHVMNKMIHLKNAKINNNNSKNDDVNNNKTKWSCTYCTFMNDMHRNICEICCKTRKNSEQRSLMNKRVSIDESVSDQNKIDDNQQQQQQQQQQKTEQSKEQEMKFDESFVREQIEIEKQLFKSKKENDLSRISEKVDKTETELNDFKEKSDQNNDIKSIDQNEIVTKIIEEKINEQFGKLKLTSSPSLVSKGDDVNHSEKNKQQSLENGPPPSITSSLDPSPNASNQINPKQCSPNFIHQRTPSSLSGNSLKPNMFSYNNNNQQQSTMMDHPTPFYQQQLHQIPENLYRMNRFSSFDDLQSLSSTSSSLLFYPDSSKNLQNSLINTSKQMIQMLREAEKKGYTADDLEAAIHFDPINPVDWLEKNWKNLYEAVMTISNKQIVDWECANGNNIKNISMITEKDAKIALHLCKGNLWQSIEKCVQRYQENKLFNSMATNNHSENNFNKQSPSKSEYFSMKVTGLGSGRANNDSNQIINNNNDDSENEFDYSEHSKLPMEEFLSSNDNTAMNPKDELLDLYMKNIKDSKNFDYNELETLIQNWQQEKATSDLEREQSRLREKERQKMQKLLDVQKRIGHVRSGGSGYLSDGTTTEEELDREVARVFQKRRPLSMTESDSDRTPTFTAKEMELFEIPSTSSSVISTINDKINQKQSQIKQKIETKLNELTMNRTNEKYSSSNESDTLIQQSPISFTDNDSENENFTDAHTEISVTPSNSPDKIVDINNNMINNQKSTTKQLKAQIVTDQIYNFFATTQPYKVVQKFETGKPKLLTPKKTKDKIEHKQIDSQIITSTSIDNTLHPMMTGEPLKIETPKKLSPSSSVKPQSSSSSLSTSPSSSTSNALFTKVNNDDPYSYEFQWARTELECELCTTVQPIQDIVVMISCTHYACRQCMKNYLTLQIREQQRLIIKCPFCNEPDLSVDQDEQVFNYLALFDPFIRHILDKDVYELFQRKMRDRALMRDPNFLWCTKCSSGFIVPNPKALTVICPDCHHVFCRQCKKQWKSEHLNRTCEEFNRWEKDNDGDYAEQLLNKHLEEFGIECPNCHFRYQLAKGGCMHFRCIQCSYDFCGGCNQPFKLGSRCFRAKLCERLGLHAHHPRNCLFYLRDKEISDLQKLLKQNNIEYKTVADNNDGNNDNNQSNDSKNKYDRTYRTFTLNYPRCQVMEQKEVNFVMKDRPCNRIVEMAGLCKLHYKEYLGNLIYRNKIDPITILSESELELTLKRENIRIPTKIRGEDYVEKLKELILEKIPLEK